MTGHPRSAQAKRRIQDSVYRAVARVQAALANPHRLELLVRGVINARRHETVYGDFQKITNIGGTRDVCRG